ELPAGITIPAPTANPPADAAGQPTSNTQPPAHAKSKSGAPATSPPATSPPATSAPPAGAPAATGTTDANAQLQLSVEQTLKVEQLAAVEARLKQIDDRE